MTNMRTTHIQHGRVEKYPVFRCKLATRVVLVALLVAVSTAQFACSSSGQDVPVPAAAVAFPPSENPENETVPVLPGSSATPLEQPTVSPAPTPSPTVQATAEVVATDNPLPDRPQPTTEQPGSEVEVVAADDPLSDPAAEVSVIPAPPVVITATLDAANGYFNQNPLPLALTRGPKQVSARHNFYAPAGTLGADEPVTLTGRNEQSSWVELRRADGSTGWAMGHIFMQDGQKVAKAAIEQLPVVAAPEPTTAERINMITFSGFSPDDEAFVRATLLELVEGDQAGRLRIPLTLAEFQAAPPLSDSSRARLLAVEALEDLPADLRNASSWEIFRWHWQNQFGFPVEMVFEGYTREDGVMIVPPLRETLLGGTYVDQFEDGLIVNYAKVDERPDRPLVMWYVKNDGSGGYQAYVYLTDQIIHEARSGNRDQQLIFQAAFAKELWSVAVIRQLEALYTASVTTGGTQLKNMIRGERFDATRMTANISIHLVYLCLSLNGPHPWIDFYLQSSFDEFVWLRDKPLN